MSNQFITHCLGFPRIGLNRELKFATEKYWQGKIDQLELLSIGKEIRKANWLLQKDKGVQLIPSNDFSYYDQILDTVALYGAIPDRFQWNNKEVSLDLYFALARGAQEKDLDQPDKKPYALEMLKWFDTNYHYLVPEFSDTTHFDISSQKPFDEFMEALQLGIKTKPVLISPVTFLHLGKNKGNFDRFNLFSELLPLFLQVAKKLADLGAEWIQVDEPILVSELTRKEKELIRATFDRLRATIPRVKIILATYFDDLGENCEFTFQLPVDVIHIDLTRGKPDLGAIVTAANQHNKSLSLGVVDGRNIWKARLSEILHQVKPIIESLASERVLLAPSCSLIHCPITSTNEGGVGSHLHNVLSFATEKLSEITSLKEILLNPSTTTLVQQNEEAWRAFFLLPNLINAKVRERVASLKPEDAKRKDPFSVRNKIQREANCLPKFPTTTIGSLPQTSDTRSQRLKFKKGQISESEYKEFIKTKIREGIQIQESLGIDVLVHGEFERNDMVEYFGEQLDGFAFTTNGWVQSFGSRYVKPPIIYGDVCRPSAMTVEWIKYASSLTQRPVKGMLTGPITILQWSFVRKDQPRSTTASQIALAIRDEVTDLERSGVKFIQVDEPAFREGLPLKKSRWEEYLDWAGNAFRLAVCSVQNQTQIHTHMCYCEFADIIHSIASLDADVISVETSRSQMKLLNTFADFHYPNEIGPGVFDIHSPRIPSVQEMVHLLQKAAKVIPSDRIWVNPDCGLKTRQYLEVERALGNMVQAAKLVRQSLH